MSAESGLKTFRDSDGLWEQYDIEEVATPEAFQRNPELVLDFYNMRRKQVMEAEPNPAHKAIANLERHFDVDVITQNIDDLHERAGSKRVLHLHGEVMKARSSSDQNLLYPAPIEIHLGDRCEKGSQLRPHVVWFGESVPEIPNACKIMSSADIVLIIGTSLNVYPAAGVLHYAPEHAEVYLIDPAEISSYDRLEVNIIRGTASKQVPIVVENLIKTHSSVI